MLNLLSLIAIVLNIVMPAPATPPAPAAAAPRPGGTYTLTKADNAASHTTIITTTENGRTVRVEVRNDQVRATVDGVAVPPERIVREGATVRVLDEKGEPLSTFSVDGGHGGPWDAAAPNVFRYVAGPRPMIGVTLSRVDDALAAQLGVKPAEVILIADVTPGQPAAKAGVQRFDIVTMVNDKSPVQENDLREAVRASKAGDTITLRVLRKGESQDLGIVVEEVEPIPHVWNERAAEEMMRAQELANEGMVHARARLHDAQRMWEERKVDWAELREKITAELREAASKLTDEDRAKIEENIRSLVESLSNLEIEIDMPRIQLFQGDGGDGDVVMVRPSTPAPPRTGVAGVLGSEQRLRTLEERMARIEALLEQLVKSQDGNAEH